MDDAGRETVPLLDDEGGAPLRCCLRHSAPGEQGHWCGCFLYEVRRG